MHFTHAMSGLHTCRHSSLVCVYTVSRDERSTSCSEPEERETSGSLENVSVMVSRLFPFLTKWNHIWLLNMRILLCIGIVPDVIFWWSIFPLQVLAFGTIKNLKCTSWKHSHWTQDPLQEMSLTQREYHWINYWFCCIFLNHGHPMFSCCFWNTLHCSPYLVYSRPVNSHLEVTDLLGRGKRPVAKTSVVLLLADELRGRRLKVSQEADWLHWQIKVIENSTARQRTCSLLQC